MGVWVSLSVTGWVTRGKTQAFSSCLPNTSLLLSPRSFGLNPPLCAALCLKVMPGGVPSVYFLPLSFWLAKLLFFFHFKSMVVLLQNRQGVGGAVHNILLWKGSPFLSLGVPPPPPHLLGLQCPPPEERRLSMPETGEKERNYLFKSYTDLEY